MADIIAKYNEYISEVVWGVPALVLLIGTGVLMTILTKGFQFTHFHHAMKKTIGSLFKNKDILKKQNNDKSISQVQQL